MSVLHYVAQASPFAGDIPAPLMRGFAPDPTLRGSLRSPLVFTA